MSKVKIDNYTFDASAKTIAFTDYTNIRLDGILLVTNVTDNIIIYNFADVTKGGTVLTNVLTLAYNTATMDDTDKLLIYYDDIIDGKNLLVANITTNTAGVSIDTSGYGSLVAQISGIWVGEIYFETSNDGAFWDIVYILSRDEVSMQDVIDQNGTYSIKRSGRYLRYHCEQISGTATINIVGREGEGLSAADMLSFAMDRTQNLPLQVQLPKDLKQDLAGALVYSDMQGPYTWNSGNAASPLVIDCTGYSTVIVQKTTAGIVTPTMSNDGINWLGTLASNITSTAATAATIPTAVGIYLIPVVARYMKLTGPASSVQCVVYLSITPFIQESAMINPPVNIAQIAGTITSNGGLAGSFAIGGNVADASSSSTSAPVSIGGVDDTKGINAATSKFIRRALVDIVGRQQIGTTTGAVPGANSSKALNEIGYMSDYKNVLEVQDTTRVFGHTTQEFLYQILQELKILNQQIYELPRLLKDGQVSMDEPEQFREEPSIFNN
jgi:hypothetical protein